MCSEFLQRIWFLREKKKLCIICMKYWHMPGKQKWWWIFLLLYPLLLASIIFIQFAVFFPANSRIGNFFSLSFVCFLFACIWCTKRVLLCFESWPWIRSMKRKRILKAFDLFSELCYVTCVEVCIHTMNLYIMRLCTESPKKNGTRFGVWHYYYYFIFFSWFT